MNAPIFKSFGLQPYQHTWQAMQTFTEQRNADTADEIWWVEHPPVFTLGRNGKPEHLLNPGNIPVIAVDRGGQVTYHGPGQIVFYCLIDLRRRKLGVRQLVTLIEQSIIELLDDHGISAAARSDAPGVYVHSEKIAALGLRIRQGCSFHGLSLNVDMDLSPFERINPCGHADLKVTQTRNLGIPATTGELAQSLYGLLTRRLG